MISKYLIVLLFFSINLNSQIVIKYESTPVVSDILYKGKWGKFKAKMVIEDGIYADYDKTHPERLKFDLYKPAEKENIKLPLVICLHSGGFVLGDKKNYIITQYCKDLVRTGEFATASINYRLIDHSSLNDAVNLIGVFASKGYTRRLLMQSLGDLRVALKYFIDNSSSLKIDPNRIYILGFSAGGILANQLLFTDLKEANEYIVENTIDKIYKNRIYKNSFKLDNSFAFNYTFTNNLSGIVSIGGGVLDQKMIDDDLETSAVPLMLIHGDKDGMVPYGCDFPFSKYSRKDIKIPYNNFYFDMGIKVKNDGLLNEDIVSSNGTVIQLTVEYGYKIKKQLIKFIIDIFTSPICGAKCINDKIIKDYKSKLIVIKNGPHVFMLNDDGLFNQTYITTRNEIYNFLISNL